MNLAFAAVALFLVFAPGVVARRAYLSYPLGKRYAASTPSDEVALAILPAILLHAFWLWLVRFTGYYPRFAILGVLLMGGHSDAAVRSAFGNLSKYFWPIVIYNVSILMAAFLLGQSARRFILATNIDVRHPRFRFPNEWYYVFTGRLWRIPRDREVALVRVDALVGKGDDAVIYSGVLVDYFLSRDGGLESICLRDVRKVLLGRLHADANISPEAPPVPEGVSGAPIPGAGLVLKYAEIVNLNVTFYVQPRRRNVVRDLVPDVYDYLRRHVLGVRDRTAR